MATDEALNAALVALNHPNDIHTILDRVVFLNTTIDRCASDEFENNQFFLELVTLFAQKASAFSSFDLLHRVRNNIVASLTSVLFLTETRLRLLIYESQWCDLDQFFRDESQYFSQETLFHEPNYLEHQLPFYNTHPLVQYTMKQCQQTLIAILLSTVCYNSTQSMEFVQELYEAVRNRLCILLNFPCALDVLDLSQYCVRIGNGRAVCTSSFAYDFSILCREIERRFDLCTCVLTDHTNTASVLSYHSFLSECSEPFLHWANGMIVTASGDNFADFYATYFMNLQLQSFELLLFQRQFPKSMTVPYKILQLTRGLQRANHIMEQGTSLIHTLLQQDDGTNTKPQKAAAAAADKEEEDAELSANEVYQRYQELSPDIQDSLLHAVLDYTLVRHWNRSLNSFFTTTLTPHVQDEPRFCYVFFQRRYYVLSKDSKPIGGFTAFQDAFLTFVYVLQKSYSGTIYNNAHEKINCSALLKSMLNG